MLKFQYNDGGRKAYFRTIVGDCVCRAIAIVTGLDYMVVYKEVGRIFELHGYAKTGAAERARDGGDGSRQGVWATQKEQLASFGFERVVRSGAVCSATPERNWEWFRTAYPGDNACIMITKSHALAVVDGTVLDQWDSRTRQNGSPAKVLELYRYARPGSFTPTKAAPKKRLTPAERDRDNYEMLASLANRIQWDWQTPENLDHAKAIGHCDLDDDWQPGDGRGARDAFLDHWSIKKNDTTLYRLFGAKNGQGMIERVYSQWDGRTIIGLKITPKGWEFLRKNVGLVAV